MGNRFRAIMGAWILMLAMKVAGKQGDKFTAAAALAMVLLVKRAAPDKVAEREAEIMAKLKQLAASDK